MQVGIVGAPNQGKSTFFNAATLAGAEMAPYPFTTIKANQGVGFIRVDCPCKEFNVRCNPTHGCCVHGDRFVPVTLLDVAGLVPDAHLGKGLGNQFLDDLRQASALIHVVDISGSTNSNGEKVEPGSFDPAETVRFLEKEIDMWFFSILKNNWGKFARKIQLDGTKLSESITNQLSGLGVVEERVTESIEFCKLGSKKPTEWGDDDLLGFATKLREVSKPIIIAANKIDVEGSEANLERLSKEFPDYAIMPVSAESELALRNASKAGIIEYTPGGSDFTIIDEAKLNGKQRAGLHFLKKFLERHKTTGVQEVLNASVFQLLKYIVVYPVGPKLSDSKGNILPDAYLLPSDSTVLGFAYAVHTDFGKNFVSAIDVKTKRNVGKDHVLKNCDVIELVCGK
ncbi:MAG: redox-regulated ATPase YchF [Candidatus Altiarchaeota archaeon]|nr:redox-regulated ATPase YchF [Candidatus Altiarchaeota archaeon]